MDGPPGGPASWRLRFSMSALVVSREMVEFVCQAMQQETTVLVVVVSSIAWLRFEVAGGARRLRHEPSST